jgi:hypothetical protein
VFFAQSSLAHLDVAAAAFTLWGLDAYLSDRPCATAAWFSVAVMAKETALLAPIGLLAVELLCPWIEKRAGRIEPLCLFRNGRAARLGALVFPAVPLVAWFGYHYARTGYAFGNPEFVRYNLSATVHPLRILLAFALRIWQLLGYMNLFMVTVAAAMAMMYPPLRDEGEERPRISIAVQSVLAAVVAAYAIAMSVVGGAALARYMLPAIPLVIILCISTLWRRIRAWRVVLAIVMAGLGVGLFVNPPYGFALEDNLAYRDYVLLHAAGDRYISREYGSTRVLTAWPASDELSRPYLGYVRKPVEVLQIEDFTLAHLEAASDLRGRYGAALLFSTKYEPRPTVFSRWPAWVRLKERFFGYHQDAPPLLAAQILGGKIVYEQHRGAQWIAVVEIETAIEARNAHPVTIR